MAGTSIAQATIDIAANIGTLQNNLAQAQQSFTRLSTGVQRNAAQMRSTFQQLGFQVGDFAVQIASGTDPLRAFIQQGSQAAGAFGPWGAVLGAAVASVGALVQGTGAAKTATDLFNESVKQSNDLLLTAAQRSEQDAAAKRTETLATSYATRAALEHNLALLGEQQRNAQEILANGPNRFTGVETQHVKELGLAIAQAESQMQKVRDEIEKLNDPNALAAGAGGGASSNAASGRVAVTDAIKDQSSALQELLDKMKEEIALSGESERQRSIDIDVRKAQDAAMQDGNLLTPQQINLVTDLAGQQFDISHQTKQLASASDDIAKSASDANVNLTGLSGSLEGLTRDFLAVTKGSSDLGSTVLNMGNDLANVISSLLGNTSGGGIGGLIGSLLGGGSSSGGGLDIGGLLGSILPFFAGLFADGGTIGAGKFGIVGEQGPELVFGPARVMSNRNWRAADGGGGTVINYNIDARGATRDAIAELRTTILGINRSIEPRAVSATMDAMRRGGNYRQVFQS